MMSIQRHRATLAGAFFCALAGPVHAIQVVGDEACQSHAVDIAAFATCENGRVAMPEAPVSPAPARAPDRTTAPKAPLRDEAGASKATTSLARDGGREQPPVRGDRAR